MSKLANPSESHALSCDKDAVRMGLIVDDEPHEAVDIEYVDTIASIYEDLNWE